MAITRTRGHSSVRLEAASFDLDSLSNVSDTFEAQEWPNISFQLVFASITGPQPAVKLQASNDETNWDDVSGATHTTSGAAESHTWWVAPSMGKQYRVAITTAATTGTCVVTAICNGRGDR